MAKIHAIPAFNDNYIWVISDLEQRYAAVVDPGIAEPVLSYLHTYNLELTHILVTHHHHDHSGGVADLLEYRKVPLFDTATLGDKRLITLEQQQISLQVQAIPGHTLDHIAFYNEDILFCGDTLFSAGCGRIFEGTPAQMFASLQFLKTLDVQIYCGHEYTLSNLIFAQHVEPNNKAIADRLREAQALRAAHKPTLPSKMAAELQFNPFLRTDQSAVITAVSQHYDKTFQSEVDLFAALREWKNNFKT